MVVVYVDSTKPLPYPFTMSTHITHTLIMYNASALLRRLLSLLERKKKS